MAQDLRERTDQRERRDEELREERQLGEQAPKKHGRLFMVLAIVAVLLVVAGAFTLLQRRSQYNALAKETETMSVATVSVTHPIVEPDSEDLVLPSTLQAYVESPIYARTSGYLKKWYHDIGSRVRKGELLAEIDTPEVDQQLAQSRAELGTAQATENLSKITNSRYQGLLSTDSVSKQEADNASGDFAAKRANVQSMEANVRRLQETEGFKHIFAPFSGVITQRKTDIGNLINAGNGGSAQALFALAQTDPIRVFVNVPEVDSPAIHKGLGAYLELQQYPGQKFQGAVARTADAIDPATRTLLTEVDVPNKEGQLLPGGYAQVHLQVKISGQRLQVPVNALLFRAEGLRAVVVDENHKTHLKPITVGRDYGTSLEVLQGLYAADWIVINPEDSLEDDVQVNVKQLPDSAVPGGHVAVPTNGNSPAGGVNAPGGHGPGGSGAGGKGSGGKDNSGGKSDAKGKNTPKKR